MAENPRIYPSWPELLVVHTLFAPLTIYTYIGLLPTRKAPGADHIKAEMLKPISTDLSHLLSWFFSLCCQWSYVPSLWRHAQVYPIFKKGDPSLPSNYRPISLTSVFRKLLELSLAPWLSSVSPPLDLAQGGFRPRRSALDQALCLHELIQSYYLGLRYRRPACYLGCSLSLWCWFVSLSASLGPSF
ncbi:hypothetical protein G6F33_013694 [Rhizopus arrhizus]|nr:hypothetical protein G6F33_013694 [Rhizopus arrhizus]